jgi:hypothetical protein
VLETLFLASFSFQTFNNLAAKPLFHDRLVLIFTEMSAEYQGRDPLELAEQAERDINSYQNKTGNARANASDSSKFRLLSYKLI